MKYVLLSLSVALALTTLPIAFQADDSGSRSSVRLKLQDACASGPRKCNGETNDWCFRCNRGTPEPGFRGECKEVVVGLI